MKNIFSLLLFVTFISCNDSTEVNIRLKNDSNVAFQNAHYNQKNFGDLNPGEITEYMLYASSYSYGAVSITIENEDYGWIPVDFVGEELLESGDYTIEFQFDETEKVLTNVFVKDN